MTKGTIVRVSGPIVDGKGLMGAKMYEVVQVGPEGLVGEIIRITGDVGTIQVYENTAGLKPGDEVVCTGELFSLSLGPGLIGNIYDGTQRPLKALQEMSGSFMKRGEKTAALDEAKKWALKIVAKKGQPATPGRIIGTVQESEVIEHRVMIPPDVQGTIAEIVPDGEYTIEQVICKVTTATGLREIKMYQRWPARMARPYAKRYGTDTPLVTGQRIIDTLFPLARGGTAAIPGGFGTGKTVMQHSLAKWSDADIIVYVGCGERGNEMTQVLTDFPELVDPRSGKPLMERTVLVANTSNMPVAAREVSIYTGITLAEYYRDMGYNVAVMADSTSRWAEALRELGGRLEEMPAEEGFPAYLATRLAQFYERSGFVQSLCGSNGSISIIGAVSPPGGDFAEPVTQHTRRFTRCFWALNTGLANARHFPSIHWLNSYSEYAENVEAWWAQIAPDWKHLRQEAMEILQREDKLQQIVKLVGPDVLPDSQRLILSAAEMIKIGFLQQSAFDDVDAYSSPQKQTLLLDAILEYYRRGVRAISHGTPLMRITELPVRQFLMRAKSQISNTDEGGLASMKSRVVQEFTPLEAEYQ